jgi:hypothetical protein
MPPPPQQRRRAAVRRWRPHRFAVGAHSRSRSQTIERSDWCGKRPASRRPTRVYPSCTHHDGHDRSAANRFGRSTCKSASTEGRRTPLTSVRIRMYAAGVRPALATPPLVSRADPESHHLGPYWHLGHGAASRLACHIRARTPAELGLTPVNPEQRAPHQATQVAPQVRAIQRSALSQGGDTGSNPIGGATTETPPRRTGFAIGGPSGAVPPGAFLAPNPRQTSTAFGRCGPAADPERVRVRKDHATAPRAFVGLDGRLHLQIMTEPGRVRDTMSRRGWDRLRRLRRGRGDPRLGPAPPLPQAVP